MLIEQILPAVVADTGTLPDRLLAEAKARGLSNGELQEFESIIPEAFIDVKAFLDKLTSLWRYEFGIPYKIRNDFVWGTDMWPPVPCLFNALSCACSRLTNATRDDYLKRLVDPSKHQAVLVEMIPGYKVGSSVAVQFEVPGQGTGNHTIDWVIGPHGGRTVLLDVKRRIIDFIKQTERIGDESIVPSPDHDPALLFRSVENKFKSSDSDSQLQGVWIATNIKQSEKLLNDAFATLDSSKVHFAIFGDWKADAYVLVRRVEDEQYLRDLFHIEQSERFT